MDDVERLSHRVMVIDHGGLIYDGDLETLRRTYGGETILVVDLEEPGLPLRVAGARVSEVQGSRQRLHFRREDVSAAAVVAEVARQARLKDLTLEEPAIEAVVRRIYLGAQEESGERL
jgi:ABC-2 type transport system ATP-binding protein